MKLLKELNEAKKVKRTVVRKETFQWLDRDKNENNLTVGELSDGVFYVTMSNQNKIQEALSNVMFNAMHKASNDERGKALKDAVLKAFKAKGNVLKALKDVTKLDDWKKI